MNPLLFLFLLIQPVRAAEVPDYRVAIGLDPASKVPRWLIEATPPAKYHFNPKAGSKVAIQGKEIEFTKHVEAPSRFGFSSSSFDLKEGDTLETVFFLCDEAKTLCVRKTLALPLRVNSDLTRIAPADKKPAALKKPRKKESR